MRKKTPRVLLVLGWYDYRLHAGIEKYAQEHGWHLSEDVVREKVIPWGWDGDGILTWLGAGDDLADFVVETGKPTVDFSFRRPQLNFAHVLEDTGQTARLAGEHFISKGLQNFLFYSDAPNWVYDERGTAFQAFLKSHGHSAKWLRWHESSAFRTDRKAWKAKREWLIHELKASPTPTGIFAASDGLALEIQESCEVAGMAVPEEMAIVGAGNSLLAVDAMSTPISSVDVNMEAAGYQGAKMLDGLMMGSASAGQVLRISPLRLVVRKSSDLVAINHPGIARSLKYMREHCREPIGVNDLARAAAMSVRAFHRAFFEHLGRSPGNELNRIRMERAKKMLCESGARIHEIADMCGYENENSFWVAFRRATGMSPNKFRKQFSVA
jgi:LacI family transcriptional regulator